MFFIPVSQVQNSSRQEPAAASLRRVVVWLDEFAPHHGTFAHGLEWAVRLRLPLHAVIAMGQDSRGIGADVLAACAATCEREGVAWSQGGGESEKSCIMNRSQPLEHDFCIIGDALMRSPGRRSVRAFLRSAATVVICPPTWHAFRRALVLNENPALDRQYVNNAAAICHGAGWAASVLTLAHSEAAARRMQDLALEAFAKQGVPADYHAMVGNKVGGAVALVGSWRRCSHVIVAKTRPGGMRRWLGFDLNPFTWELADRFAVLPLAVGSSPLVERMLAAAPMRQLE
jgi:hypothetical protein